MCVFEVTHNLLGRVMGIWPGGTAVLVSELFGRQMEIGEIVGSAWKLIGLGFCSLQKPGKDLIMKFYFIFELCA